MDRSPVPLGHSLAALLAARADDAAGRDAFVWLKDGRSAERILHFGALGNAAAEWAGRIAEVSEPGDRVLLLLPPGLDMVEAFWGCLLAGRVAVPLPSPDPARWKNAAPRLRAVIADAGARVAIGAEASRAPLAALDAAAGAEGRPPLAVLVPQPPRVATSGAALAALLSRPLPGGAAPAYLQYTSGSTGAPRGAVLTHDTVLAQCTALRTMLGVDAKARVLSWLPHHHDYGLVLGLLLPVAAGATAWLMSPLAFLRQPLRWLDAIDRFAITHTGAPNFAYAACVREAATAGWQGGLHSLRSATCGAEPIRIDTMREFAARFAANGLDAGALMPGYGMAETVLGATSVPMGRGLKTSVSPDGVTRVACGRPIPGMAVAIVDPESGKRLEDGAEGEIWLRGSSVGSGYWNAPEASRASFGARTADGDGPWLRSGDLGFLDAGGEVVVSGRLKDLIIVNGRNVAPQDVEWAAQAAAPGLREGAGAAFAIDGADGERVVLVQEVERGVAPEGLAGVERALRDALLAQHELALADVVLVRPGSLPRTSSGKLQRRAAAEAWREGRFESLRVVPAAAAASSSSSDAPREGSTAQAVAALWREVLPRGSAPPSLRLGDRFTDIGGDSLAATRLASRLQAHYGVDWSVADVFARAGLGEMAAALDAVGGAGRRHDAAPVATLIRQSRAKALPASSSQRRMWMVQQLTPGTTAYNMGFAFRIHGELDPARMAQAFERVAARHEAFRTRLPTEGDDVVQRLDAPPVALRVEDLSALPDAQREAALLDRGGDWLQMPFDLENGPLHRALLLRTSPTAHALVWSVHHAIGDLWSFAIMLRELAEAYEALEAGGEPAWPALELDYADYAAWQREPAQQAALVAPLAYWTAQLANLEPLLLPVDFPRRAAPDGRGRRLFRPLEPALRDAVRRRARELGVTPYMLLLAAFQLLLARWTGQTDIAVGTPIANRHRLATEPLVGTLVNTLVLRTRVDGADDFPSLAARVRDTALAAFAHQDAPFERLVEALVRSRDPLRPPLVQAFFSHFTPVFERSDLAGRQVSPLNLERSGAQFELSVVVDLDLFGQLFVEYASDRFTAASATAVADAYIGLLRQIVDGPRRRLDDYALALPSGGRATSVAEDAVAGPMAPARAPSERPDSEQATLLEATVVRIAVGLLGTTGLSGDDNFFDAGGHSLLALRFAHEIAEATGYRPSVLSIAQSSFGAIALAADAARAESSPVG